MYFTISHEEPSRPALAPEAQDAYRRLRRHALSLSASVAGEAEAATEAFARALASGTDESWAAFVAAAAALVRRSESVAPSLHPGSEARAAREFFAQIIRENGDLLAIDALALA